MRAVDCFGVLAACEELPPLRDLYELDAVIAGSERVPDLAQGGAHRRRARLRVEGQQLLDGHRSRRRVERRLNELRERAHGGSGWE